MTLRIEAPLTREVIQRYQHVQPEDPRDSAELAKLDVIQALTPEPFSVDEVIGAVGNATNPNAVSRATRARLPHRPIV
ncbi:MAG: hypothetical protein UT24_C0012G0061 [Candidatus Woesebacteria bacterium GW2011_GWB1_39_12]|uniref:Uncharacterized protein n=2 Tax=Candidatus Woeseibacteriota TaxID=1752722 RepID=A0A0G0MBL3_9BACT|nr:MAG: hypothetical protein UT23_C0008G0023 [Candidatus Woesebacteria bacterium GW2011_GWA1_39_12]KKR00439.1 MAG: hypothetical protein UT24_C0012G0061 [Candidatus Woesebacteria bacterium GW2011_GWB1_39_12]